MRTRTLYNVWGSVLGLESQAPRGETRGAIFGHPVQRGNFWRWEMVAVQVWATATLLPVARLATGSCRIEGLLVESHLARTPEVRRNLHVIQVLKDTLLRRLGRCWRLLHKVPRRPC
jgi:hypothetical protein